MYMWGVHCTGQSQQYLGYQFICPHSQTSNWKGDCRSRMKSSVHLYIPIPWSFLNVFPQTWWPPWKNAIEESFRCVGVCWNFLSFVSGLFDRVAIICPINTISTSPLISSAQCHLISWLLAKNCVAMSPTGPFAPTTFSRNCFSSLSLFVTCITNCSLWSQVWSCLEVW